LQPAISRETLAYHYDRHHRGYVRTLNELIAGSPLRGLPLDEVVRKASGKLFNCAAQAWNHSFYWHCLTPERGVAPCGELEERVRKDFGSLDGFMKAFRSSAVSKFGSRWTWLVLRPDGSLAIENTADADSPIRQRGPLPLLVCDVWEHAYYLDYRSNRARYVDAFLTRVNWEFVAENFAAATEATQSWLPPARKAEPASAELAL
jgi:Fe-Mn family superoxide dismutase